MKQIISLITVICIIFTCIPESQSSNYSYAEEPVTKYHLDIGAQHIWGTGGSPETAAWQDGYNKGESIAVNVSLDFGRPVKVINAYPYLENRFQWNNPNYTFNETLYLKSQHDFDEYYKDYVSESLANVKAEASGNVVKLSYNARLKTDSNLDFDLKEKLNLGKLSFILEVMGGENVVKNNYPDIYKRLQEGAAGKMPDTLYGFMYFTPVIIEYQEIPIIESLCKMCEKCPLTGTDTSCTSKSCKVYGTESCGCYTYDAPQVPPPVGTTGDCKNGIQWSEIQWHYYKCSGCKKKKSGGRYCPGTHNCNHVYSYQTTLTSTANLSPTVFKSGYGYSVAMSNKIATKPTGNWGACGKSKSKANEKIPVPPTYAEIRTNYTVKNKLGTQSKIVPLVKTGGTATSSTFTPTVNKISETKAKIIYTDVALKGTAKKPVAHYVEVYCKGGGVNGVEFCGSVTKSFSINGDMYEDDWTVDRRK